MNFSCNPYHEVQLHWVDMKILQQITYPLTAEPIPEVEEVITKQKPQAQVPRPKTSRTFVNFERAKKQQKIAQVCIKFILN